MKKRTERWKKEIKRIEEIEKALDYDQTKGPQEFTVRMNTDELQLLLDALETHKGVVRMRLEQEEKNYVIDIGEMRKACRRAEG